MNVTATETTPTTSHTISTITHHVCCDDEHHTETVNALCGSVTVAADLFTENVDCTVCRDMSGWEQMPCPRGGHCKFELRPTRTRSNH